MIRHSATSLCFFGLMAADVLLVGAAAMRAKAPVDRVTVAVPLPPPAASLEPSLAPSAMAVSDVPIAKERQVGVASWYGDHWQGRVTASGKPFDDRKMTAAHRTLPLNTRVRVTNLESGRSVEVTITDRGPYVDGRVIDLSAAAAKRIGMVKEGLVPVQITTVAPPATRPPATQTAEKAPEARTAERQLPDMQPPDTQTKVASLDVR